MEGKENECISSFFDSLDEWLSDENRIVTCRTVSLTFSLHINYAKHVLEEFVKSEHCKNRSISVTYCISGQLADDDSKTRKVVIVPEEMKEKMTATMLSPVSCHVYSIQACQLKTADMLYMADFDLLKSKGLDANRFSAVKCPLAGHISRSVTADVPADGTTSQAANNTVPSKAACNSIQSAFSSKSTESKKPPEKAAPAQSKASTAFGRLFANAAAKQSSTEDKQTSAGGDAKRSPEVSQTVSRSPGKSKATSSAPSGGSKSAASKTVGDSRTKVADTLKTSQKQSSQTKSKQGSGKRRRIMSVSSSEEDEADKAPSSPEYIPPSPPVLPVIESEPMEVEQAPPTADGSAEFQRMERKLVSKTYVNEEGYMVTEKVWQSELVSVSASDEAAKKPAAAPPTTSTAAVSAAPQAKKQPAKKPTPPQNSRKKQSSLTNFFQKK